MSLFGNRLRQLRKQSNLTQKELAAKLKLAFSTISMYERGIREPDFETTEAIADFFNVSMDYLLGKTQINYVIPPEYVNTIILTNHEKKLITAYRNKPEMQASIDKLLDI
ncbi:MAG: helix-turn-helix transcriptional regulator [Clostridia bacterium]|nr:helix-turn-helix transcriptional regulator [Clostridia bacterium]